MNVSGSRQRAQRPLVPVWVQVIGFALMVGFLIWRELPVWLTWEGRTERLQGWLCGRQADWLIYTPFLLLFPGVWLGFRRRSARSTRMLLSRWLGESPSGPQANTVVAWLNAGLVFAVSLGMSLRTGENFSGLPPAFHDEYSYLFQAETFLAGRWAFPSFEPMSELFDQMHVLNEGAFASRYFPGTGAWIAPFLFLGMPWLGHQLAQGFAAMMVFWTGRELSNSGVGVFAGLLFAFSPGPILFSNLLLAHHPTLIGLTLFLWAMLRAMRTGSLATMLMAGIGLSFAMLCRPMTAAGFALPFGLILLVRWVRDLLRPSPPTATSDSARITTQHLLAMGAPLLLGLVVIGVQNTFITGDVFRTPYQRYNEIYTPRHVYGFGNVERGARDSGPLVSAAYDRWAKNLNPHRAIENVQTRLLQSWRWIFGIVPLSVAGLLLLLTPRSGDHRWLWIVASIFTLHLAHVPYWFPGIMGWHYVFETAPLWVLIFAEITRRLFVQWQSSGRWMMKYIWLLFTGASLAANLLTVSPLWPAQLEQGIVEVRFPRQRYLSFRQRIDELRAGQPAIVFVIPDPQDVSMDYVTNHPQLNGPVLVARIKDRSQLAAAAELFPDRYVLLFDAKRREFELPRRFPD